MNIESHFIFSNKSPLQKSANSEFGAVQKLGSKMEKQTGKTPRKSRRKTAQTLEAQAEKR